MQFLFSNYTSHFEHLRFMGSVDIGGTLATWHGVKNPYEVISERAGIFEKSFLQQKSICQNPYKFPYQHWKDFE